MTLLFDSSKMNTTIGTTTFKKYIALAIKKGYLNSEGKNEKLTTWQLAMLVEHLCNLSGITAKWKLAQEIGGMKKGTYRMAKIRALDSKPEAGDFQKQLYKDFK